MLSNRTVARDMPEASNASGAPLTAALGLCKEAPLYKAAEAHINKGLSPFSRIILGLFSALFGLAMVLVAPQ